MPPRTTIGPHTAREHLESICWQVTFFLLHPSHDGCCRSNIHGRSSRASCSECPMQHVVLAGVLLWPWTPIVKNSKQAPHRAPVQLLGSRRTTRVFEWTNLFWRTLASCFAVSPSGRGFVQSLPERAYCSNRPAASFQMKPCPDWYLRSIPDPKRPNKCQGAW